jgi:hypothetical protein
MTADEIIGRIRERIEQLSMVPTIEPTDAHEIDAKLFELHLLYTHATGQFEEWKKLRRKEMQKSPEWMDRVREDRVYQTTPDMLAVIDYWKTFRESLDRNTTTAIV